MLKYPEKKRSEKESENGHVRKGVNGGEGERIARTSGRRRRVTLEESGKQCRQ